MIPGYHTSSYELDNDYSRLNNLTYNPYDRSHFTNTIGDSITNEEHHNSMWNEISEFLVHCKYKEQKHVQTATQSQLKVFSMNIRSLTKQISHLREEITQYSKYDILCLNETNCVFDKLPNGINDVVLDGFHEPFLQDPIRKSGRGGGLAIYVHKRVVDFDKIECFNPNPDPTNTSGEFQFIKIHQCKGFNRTKVIANIYRSPSRQVESFNLLLESILPKLDRHSSKHIILAGDFNVDLIKHDSNSSYQNLIDIMSNYGFIQLVSRPTRVTDHSASLIDHLYTNNQEDTISCNVLTTAVSDHLAIVTTINLDNTSSSPYRLANTRNNNHTDPAQSEFRVYNEANNLKFNELISEEDWDSVLSEGLDAQQQFNKFNETYTKHYNTAFPLKSKRIRRQNERVNPKPWMLEWLEEAIARRDMFYHVYIKAPTDTNFRTYKKMKDFCEKHVNLAKDKYYKKYFDQHKSNSKKQWQMINTLLNRKSNRSGAIKLKDLHGNIISTNKDVSEKFNGYFSGIASNLKSEISGRTVFDPGGFQEFLQGPCTNTIDLKPTAADEVHRIINDFKNKSTLDTKVEALKIANNCFNFTNALAKVINSSFEQGLFPQALKLARVVPIYKTGSKTDVENYRPISLLSCFSKIYEKIMHNRIIDFLDTNGSLFESQYGFRPGRSCEHALLDAQNIILNSLSKNEVAMLLLIDFSKAFDLVDHKILLNKLNHYGIRGAYLPKRISVISNADGTFFLGGTL